MNEYHTKLTNSFDAIFDKNLLESFPACSRQGIKANKDKYRFELEQIAIALDSCCSDKTPVLMDVGCGFGVNLIISKLMWNIEAYGLDRFDEFNDVHNREVGTRSMVIDRIKLAGVKVKELDIVNNQFDFEPQCFDVVTNFDVIEHFAFSPISFLKKMYSSVAVGGTLIIGTPNQTHLRNRFKCLIGQNTWEDFDYYISADTFYGHVRELTPKEFGLICNKISSRFNIHYSTYPLQYSAAVAKSKLFKMFYQLAISVIKLFPSLNYYMVAAITKQR